MWSSTKLRLILALLGGGALWALVIYKALYIPITHDEMTGPTHYCNHNVWRIMMFPDASPNNHILNTLLTKLSIFLFGNHQWAVRLPNILSFGVYFYAAYQICNILFKKDNILFFGGLALFLCNPFLLDFFSLCRGYGMSNAFMLCSTLFCLQGFSKQKEQAIWLSVVLGLLASYANFTLLVYWCAINIMAFLYFTSQYLQDKDFVQLLRKSGLLAVQVFGYLALIYTPIYKMQSTNQFIYWQSNGFFKDTMVSLVNNSLYGSKMIDVPFEYLAFAAVVIFISSGGALLYHGFKKGWKKVNEKPLFIAFAILGLTVLVNILQSIILHTPNLTNRTALFFYPLFIFLVVAGIHHVANRTVLTARLISSIVIMLGIWHLLRTVMLDRVREWWYDANTFQVMRVIEQEAEKQDKVLTLRTNWGFYPSFAYYTLTGKAPFLDIGEYNKDIDTTNQFDYYYIFDSDYPLLQNKYDIIERYDGGARMLLKSK